MLIEVPNYSDKIRCTHHIVSRLKTRCGINISKQNFARQYFDLMKENKIFFFQDYKADLFYRDFNFIVVYFSILEFNEIPIVVIIGAEYNGDYVMITTYNYDNSAYLDLRRLYIIHRMKNPSEPLEIPIKPKNLRKDRDPNKIFISRRKF